ncbi:MAG: hypothetical protein K6G80_10420 [Treponema sp.]|nr:hypothetical protein [Treponema sp.]
MLEKQEMMRMFRKYAIFAGLVVGMVSILLTVTILSRSSWQQGIALSLQDTLNARYSDVYAVEDGLVIPSPFSTSAAVYNLTAKKAGSSALLHQYGIIVRIPTIAGPAPAVFLYSDDAGVVFVGYALHYGKAKSVFENAVGLKIIQYWQKQVYTILKSAGVEVKHE